MPPKRARRRQGGQKKNWTHLKPAAGTDPDYNYKINDAMLNLPVPDRFSARRQIRWLKRAAHWVVTGTAWRGRKILGAGAYGFVALFSRAGRPSAQNPHNTPQRFVVKQSRHSLRSESELLHTIKNAGFTHVGGSAHTVELYRTVEREGGSNTHTIWDRNPTFNAQGQMFLARMVWRMYMEYCEGGDLETVFELPTTRQGRGAQFAEEYIWRTFECLARCLMMLETGSENPLPLVPASAAAPPPPPAAAPAAWRPIVHFDIKPANVLIGDHPPQHQRLPILKMADFGLALSEPVAGIANNANWIAATEPRFTPGFGAPELVYRSHPNRSIGSSSNIWACGAVIHQMMIYQDFQQTDPAVTQIIQNTFMTTTTGHALWSNNIPNPPYRTFGENLDTPNIPYSTHLVELVHRCLAYDPADRPTANELWGIINPILSAPPGPVGRGGYNHWNGRQTRLRKFEPTALPVGRPRFAGPIPVPTPQAPETIRDIPVVPVNLQVPAAVVNANLRLRLNPTWFPRPNLLRTQPNWQLLFP